MSGRRWPAGGAGSRCGRPSSGRGALVRRDLVAAAVRRSSRVGDAPVQHPRVTRKLRAHLANAVAEADHVVEALGEQLVDVLRPAARDVDAAQSHGPHGDPKRALWDGCRRCGPRRLRRVRRSSSASAICERALLPVQRKQTRVTRPVGVAVGGPGSGTERGVQRSGRGSQQGAHAIELEAVVEVTTVRGAAARGDELTGAQLAEVVGREALRQAERGGQLADAPIAGRERLQQAPSHGMPGQPRTRRAARPGRRWRRARPRPDITSIYVDAFSTHRRGC